MSIIAPWMRYDEISNSNALNAWRKFSFKHLPPAACLICFLSLDPKFRDKKVPLKFYVQLFIFCNFPEFLSRKKNGYTVVVVVVSFESVQRQQRIWEVRNFLERKRGKGKCLSLSLGILWWDLFFPCPILWSMLTFRILISKGNWVVTGRKEVSDLSIESLFIPRLYSLSCYKIITRYILK